MKKNEHTLWLGVGFSGLLFLSSIIAPKLFLSSFKKITLFTLDTFGDFYLYFGLGLTLVLILLAILPSGNLVLGKGKSHYSTFSWVSMLFSTGMGPGMMLRAVQEPISYFHSPPNDLGYDPISYALAYTFFHWGLTPWAMYGFFGLIIGYFTYVKGRTLLPSSALPTTTRLGIATATNAFMILCTLIGVMSCLGLGSRQLLGGFSFLSSLKFAPAAAIGILLLISFISIYSARSGLGKSIRFISTLNISTMLLLLFFVLSQSDLNSFFRHLGEALWIYLKDFVGMSLNVGKYQVDQIFLLDWTYFYWAFWLAWVPFTGVFIARISKGRSIRQFVFGSLLAPSIGTFFWFGAFGHFAMNTGKSAKDLSGQFGSVYSAIFSFFNDLPLSTISNGIALVLLFTFLITSVDSAIYVLSMFSDKGKENPARPHRIVWGCIIGALTAGLIYVGQETLLELTSFVLISFALPFSFIYLVLCINFLRDIYLHLYSR